MPVDQQRMIFLAPKSSNRAPGSLQVDCLIQTSGVPKDCKVLSAQGAEDVSGSILGWLASGAKEEQILEDYPELHPEDFLAVFAFAAKMGRRVAL